MVRRKINFSTTALSMQVLGDSIQILLHTSKLDSKRDLCNFLKERDEKKITELLPLMLPFLPFLCPEVIWSSKWLVLFSPFLFLSFSFPEISEREKSGVVGMKAIQCKAKSEVRF